MSKPDPNCTRCEGTGLIVWTGGEHRTVGNTFGGSSTVNATPEHPVCKVCPCVRRASEAAPPATDTPRRYGPEED